jgi:hypothetical protein
VPEAGVRPPQPTRATHKSFRNHEISTNFYQFVFETKIDSLPFADQFPLPRRRLSCVYRS